MDLFLAIIQGIGVVGPIGIDIIKIIQQLFPSHQVVIVPVLQGWLTNAAEVQALDTAWNAANPPVPTPA